MSDVNEQMEVDSGNKLFWDELCGSALAKFLEINDASPESLKKFDDYYMDYYPYLDKYLSAEQFKDKTVLEVGLGYGTLANYLAKSCKHYSGLDIAKNAVAMTNHRISENNLSGEAEVGSILNHTFPENHFDFIVSIGCFHHTGNMQRCIDQTYKFLKPGGKAIIMVYNQFSLRQWVNWPKSTGKSLINQLVQRPKKEHSSEEQRLAYDASTDGEIAAPETVFYSKHDIHKIFSQFKSVQITRENFDDQFTVNFCNIRNINFGLRTSRLSGFWAQKFGLDLYIEATK